MSDTGPRIIKLARGEKIIAVVPQFANGPGWSNAPTWVYIETFDGKLRTECIQPEERSADLQALYSPGAAMASALIAAVLSAKDKP